MSKTMIAMVVVLALTGMAAILEARGRAAARSPVPDLVAPAPTGEAPLAPAPAPSAREGRPLRHGVWVG